MKPEHTQLVCSPVFSSSPHPSCPPTHLCTGSVFSSSSSRRPFLPRPVWWMTMSPSFSPWSVFSLSPPSLLLSVFQQRVFPSLLLLLLLLLPPLTLAYQNLTSSFHHDPSAFSSNIYFSSAFGEHQDFSSSSSSSSPPSFMINPLHSSSSLQLDCNSSSSSLFSMQQGFPPPLHHLYIIPFLPEDLFLPPPPPPPPACWHKPCPPPRPRLITPPRRQIPSERQREQFDSMYHLWWLWVYRTITFLFRLFFLLSSRAKIQSQIFWSVKITVEWLQLKEKDFLIELQIRSVV